MVDPGIVEMANVANAPVNGVTGDVDGKKPAVVEVMASVDDTRAGAEDVQDEDWDYPFPTDFKISEHPIDEVRPLKVSKFPHQKHTEHTDT